MHCEGCLGEMANAVITADPCSNEAPEEGSVSSRIVSSIQSGEGMGSAPVPRKKIIWGSSLIIRPSKQGFW